jgi:hypothetical protein
VHAILLLVGGKRITAKEEIDAIHWSTWTSVLGAEVNGIWPKYTQVSAIMGNVQASPEQNKESGMVGHS